MKLTTTDNDSLRLDFRVQLSPDGLVSVNGQPIGQK
jgi:hypothetical protein